MDKVYNFLKFNGTVTGGEYESDEVITVCFVAYPKIEAFSRGFSKDFASSDWCIREFGCVRFQCVHHALSVDTYNLWKATL